jgi:hypothetical protein
MVLPTGKLSRKKKKNNDLSTHTAQWQPRFSRGGKREIVFLRNYIKSLRIVRFYIHAGIFCVAVRFATFCETRGQ